MHTVHRVTSRVINLSVCDFQIAFTAKDDAFSTKGARCLSPCVMCAEFTVCTTH